MRKVIFRAKHGEGKTKWLIEMVKESAAKGRQIYYMGGKVCFLKFREKCWAAGVCGVRHMSECIPDGEFDVFTDDFFKAFTNIEKKDLDFAEEYATNWYITMEDEDFF